MKLHYHQLTLELIGREPIVDDGGLHNLPASVAEWFSLVDGVELLKKYSNQDAPLTVTKFKAYRNKHTELIVFMYENQGVCWWAFENNGEDDPPVYVNLDPPPDNWLFCCETFSSFIYSRLFDFFHWQDEDLFLMGSGDSMDAEILAELGKDYNHGPTTYGWPGDTQYRFSLGDQKITVQCGGSGSDWYCSANTPVSLREIHNKLKPWVEWHIPTKIDW